MYFILDASSKPTSFSYPVLQRDRYSSNIALPQACTLTYLEKKICVSFITFPDGTNMAFIPFLNLVNKVEVFLGNTY